MKVLVRVSSLRLLLKWTQRALLAGAALMLGYYGFVLLDARMFQLRAMQTLERPQIDKPGRDALVGRIEVERLGISVAVVEGTGDAMLRRAAGHLTGTVLPGQPGNIGIAAHRDTFFRPLRNIRRGDIITLTTLHGKYRYRVASTKIVAPDDCRHIEFGRKRDFDPGHLLSLLLHWLRSQAIHSSGNAGPLMSSLLMKDGFP